MPLEWSAFYLQEPRHGRTLNVYRQMSKWIKKMYISAVEYYSAIKKNNEIMPFAATFMNPGIIIWSKSEIERQISIWNHFLNDINELIYKTETDS